MKLWLYILLLSLYLTIIAILTSYLVIKTLYLTILQIWWNLDFLSHNYDFISQYHNFDTILSILALWLFNLTILYILQLKIYLTVPTFFSDLWLYISNSELWDNKLRFSRKDQNSERKSHSYLSYFFIQLQKQDSLSLCFSKLNLLSVLHDSALICAWVQRSSCRYDGIMKALCHRHQSQPCSCSTGAFNQMLIRLSACLSCQMNIIVWIRAGVICSFSLSVDLSDWRGSETSRLIRVMKKCADGQIRALWSIAEIHTDVGDDEY